MATRRKRPAAEVDEHSVRELQLWADSDADAYRQAQFIYRNMHRRFLNKTYDHSKAPKGWLYAIEKANASYKKEFGYSFPLVVRRAVAKNWADYYHEELERGVETI